MINKKTYIRKIRELSQKFLRVSVLFENLAGSLEQRINTTTLKEMKEIKERCFQSTENILIELKGGKKD